MSSETLFVAGIPATGKSWLGQWLAENHGYIHIDAEKDHGADFDKAGIHTEWDDLIARGRADRFVSAVLKLSKPVVVNWGFPTGYLYVVSALQAEGICAWWFQAQSKLAREAFLRRGGIDPSFFDKQMDDIEGQWLLIASVFGSHIVEGLRPDGSQRTPEQIWRDISATR